MLTKVKETNKSSAAALSPFAKKWQEIEKKQKRNANVNKKIEALYQIFQEDILPDEQKLADLLAQETRHLMSFLPRKSFSQYQREELQHWIESNLDSLSQHPFADHQIFEEIAQAYNDILVLRAKESNENHDFSFDEIDYMRTMANELFNGEKVFTDEELIDFMRDPSVFQQALSAFMEEQSQETKQSEYSHDDDDIFAEDDFFQGEDANYRNGNQRYRDQQRLTKQEKLKSLFNSSKLNKLYKTLANKLHPDKETNEHLKAEKSELMARLVTAKKNKDAFTLISMFHQFAPESEHTLFEGSDEELTQALVGLLNEKLHLLDQENRESCYENGIKSMIWKKFNGRSKKITQENIDAHLADLEDSHTRLNYYIDEVKTVKSLKEILSERYEQRSFNPFAHGEFSVEDLDVLFR